MIEQATSYFLGFAIGAELGLPEAESALVWWLLFILSHL